MPTMQEMLREEQVHEGQDLERGLKSRHIQMIAIGGAIGVGLFLGSARAINVAGPALLLSYTFLGAMIFFIMRALGEWPAPMRWPGANLMHCRADCDGWRRR